MKIVITGSNGYIGNVVCRQLLHDFPESNFEFIDLKIGTDYKDVKGISADVLVHLGAYVSVPESHEEFSRYYQNNCINYEEFLRNNIFNHIIYASSNAIYDDNEDINPASVYGSTKLEGEFITKRNSDNYTVLRFANPVGAIPELHSYLKEEIGVHSNLMSKMAMSLINDTLFTVHDNPNMIRDFYPVYWIGEVISSFISKPVVGVFNLGSSQFTNCHELIEVIADKYFIHTQVVPSPKGTSTGFINESIVQDEIKSLLLYKSYFCYSFLFN